MEREIYLCQQQTLRTHGEAATKGNGSAQSVPQIALYSPSDIVVFMNSNGGHDRGFARYLAVICDLATVAR